MPSSGLATPNNYYGIDSKKLHIHIGMHHSTCKCMFTTMLMGGTIVIFSTILWCTYVTMVNLNSMHLHVNDIIIYNIMYIHYDAQALSIPTCSSSFPGLIPIALQAEKRGHACIH